MNINNILRWQYKGNYQHDLNSPILSDSLDWDDCGIAEMLDWFSCYCFYPTCNLIFIDLLMQGLTQYFINMTYDDLYELLTKYTYKHLGARFIVFNNYEFLYGVSINPRFIKINGH